MNAGQVLTNMSCCVELKELVTSCCEKKKTGLAVYAENPGIILFAYLCALLPLASIYALDFITDRWKSVRRTRLDGKIQLVMSIPPLVVVVFYVHLQKLAEDYKEMAAAITAAVLCIFHILRTLWGLTQLHVFKQWNVRSLRVLTRMGYDFPIYVPEDKLDVTSKLGRVLSAIVRCLRRVFGFKKKYDPNFDYAPTFELNSAKALERTVDDHMMVNNSLIDNEFNGADIPCRITFVNLGKAFPLTTRLLSRQYKVLESVGLVFCLRTAVLWTGKIISFLCRLSSLLRSVVSRIGQLTSRVFRSLFKRTFPLILRLWHAFPIAQLSISDFLKSRKPEECAIRWTVSFLSRFGSEWLTDNTIQSRIMQDNGSDQILLNGEFSHKLAKFVAFHITHSVEARATPQQVSILSPIHVLCSNLHEPWTSTIDVTGKSMLPFQMRGRSNNTKLELEDYATSIIKGISAWHEDSLNQLEIIQKQAVQNITPCQVAFFSKLIEERDIHDLPIVRGDMGVPYLMERQRFKTFLWQLGYDDRQSDRDARKVSDALPVLRKSLGPDLDYDTQLRDDCAVLQASVHVDNWVSLGVGKMSLSYDAAKREVEDDEAILHGEVFSAQKRVEWHRLELEAVSNEEPDILAVRRIKFLGCVMESVRSFLADWIYEPDSNSGNLETPINSSTFNWKPQIPEKGYQIIFSDQLEEAMRESETESFDERQNQAADYRRKSLHMRLVWEIQLALMKSTSKSPYSECLMMLCMLGYPSIRVSKFENCLESHDPASEVFADAPPQDMPYEFFGIDSAADSTAHGEDSRGLPHLSSIAPTQEESSPRAFAVPDLEDDATIQEASMFHGTVTTDSQPESAVAENHIRGLEVPVFSAAGTTSGEERISDNVAQADSPVDVTIKEKGILNGSIVSSSLSDSGETILDITGPVYSPMANSVHPASAFDEKIQDRVILNSLALTSSPCDPGGEEETIRDITAPVYSPRCDSALVLRLFDAYPRRSRFTFNISHMRASFPDVTIPVFVPADGDFLRYVLPGSSASKAVVERRNEHNCTGLLEYVPSFTPEPQSMQDVAAEDGPDVGPINSNLDIEEARSPHVSISLSSIEEGENVPIACAQANEHVSAAPKSRELQYSSYKIEIAEAPQELHITLQWNPDLKAYEAQIRSNEEHDVKEFCWQSWKDAFMGRVWAQSEWRKKYLPDAKEKLRKEVILSKLTNGIAPPVESEDQLTYWRGWPPFLSAIAGFEMQVSKSDLISNNYNSNLQSPADLDEQLDQLEERNQGDISSSRGPEVGSERSLPAIDCKCGCDAYEKFSRSKQLWDKGEEKDALPMFRRCIVEDRNTLAIEHCISNVLEKVPDNRELVQEILRSLFLEIERTLEAKAKSACLHLKNHDFKKLVQLFSNLHDKSHKSLKSLVLYEKGLALLLGCQTDTTLYEQCIETFQSVVKLPTTSDFDQERLMTSYFCLALCYFRRYCDKGCASDYELGEAFFMRMSERDKSHMRELALDAALLMERGSITVREYQRIPLLRNRFSKLLPKGVDLEKVLTEIFSLSSSTNHRIPENPKDASKIYNHRNSALKMSPPRALNRLAMIHHKDARHDRKKFISAKQLYKAAIAYEESPGQKDIFVPSINAKCNLAVLHREYRGFGIESSKKLFREAIEMRCAREAQLRQEDTMLSTEILNRKGIPVVVQDKRGFWKKSAKRAFHMDETPLHIGELQGCKTGFQRQKRFGVSFYGPAHEHSTSMNNLAVLMELGKTTKRNVPEAKKLYESAVEIDKNPIAMYNLALLLALENPSFGAAKSKRLLSIVEQLGADLLSMPILKAQLPKARAAVETEIAGKLSFGVDEIDDCFAYVKKIG